MFSHWENLNVLKYKSTEAHKNRNTVARNCKQYK